MVKLELISHFDFVFTENLLKGVRVVDHAVGRLV
jgi:hypothetical protein